MKPPPLPPAIQSVEVGRFVSVSAVVAARECLLRAVHGLREEQRLPPHPNALLGSILHETMNDLAGLGMSPTWTKAYSVFEANVEKKERELVADRHTRNLVPLRDKIDLGTWSGRIAYLRSWTENKALGTARVSPKLAVPQEKPIRNSVSDLHVMPGTEVALHDYELRLRGRADLISVDNDGAYCVTDFKTGPIHVNDELRQEYVLQLQLYAWMLESMQPRVEVRLLLDGDTRVQVSWLPADRERVRKFLDIVLERLPEGQPIEAVSLATPGSWCRWCDIRHRCKSYREIAPMWWGNYDLRPDGMPYDVFGKLEHIELDENGFWQLRLSEPSGTRVHISGLAAKHDLHDIGLGAHIWLFDLEPSERLKSGKERSSNFHELRVDGRGNQAHRLSLFMVR